MQLPGRLGDFATGRQETESSKLSSSLNYLDLVVKVADQVAPARFGSMQAPRRFGTPPGQTGELPIAAPETKVLGGPVPGAVAAPETKVTGEPLPSAAGAAVKAKSETLPVEKTEKGGPQPAAAPSKMFDFESADTYRPIKEKPPMKPSQCNGYLDCAGAWAADQMTNQVMNRLFK